MVKKEKLPVNFPDLREFAMARASMPPHVLHRRGSAAGGSMRLPPLTKYYPRIGDADEPFTKRALQMTGLLRGPHHGVGIAVSVAERIFHFMKTRAEAHGGSLSVSDIEGLRTQFLASLPKAAHFFEEVDRHYAEACGGTAAECFSHDNILVTLLAACVRKAALTAFPQAEHVGGDWLNQFYGGVASYLRRRFCSDADDRLSKAYFETAARLGAKLQVADLLGDEGARKVLKECLAPLAARDAVARMTEPLCAAVNTHIATKRGVATADPAKITEAEVRKFLSFLPPQLAIVFGAQAAA
jgi:hypothetical protein